MRYQITLVKRELLSLHQFEFETKTSPDLPWDKFIERSKLNDYVEANYGTDYLVREIDPIDLPETPKFLQEILPPVEQEE